MTDEREEWGPWIEWRGKFAVPSGVNVGDWYQAIGTYGEFIEKRVEINKPQAWKNIERFRIRHPRALTQLRDMVENLPAPERERADA